MGKKTATMEDAREACKETYITKEEKLSPVDKGKEIWERLYKERIRL